MRIAIYWEQDAWGGVDTQLLTLLREWPCATDQFILYYNRGNRGFHRIRENLLRVPNLRIQELASYSYNELVRRLPKVRPISWLRWCLFLIQPMLFLVMAMRLSIIFGKEQEIDLMLSDNGGYPAAWGCLSALLGARWAGIQTRCLLIHHSSTAPSPFMSTYERMIDRLVGKITSAVICVSYATRFSFLSRRNINEEDVRIRVVHNGISSKSAPFHTEVRFDIRAALELTDQMPRRRDT